jgi:lipocalin
MHTTYPWAIVSDASGSELFVLARDPAEFKVQYDDLVLQKAQSLGFTGDSTKPIAIEQGEQCQYASLLELSGPTN